MRMNIAKLRGKIVERGMRQEDVAACVQKSRPAVEDEQGEESGERQVRPRRHGKFPSGRRAT